MIPFIGTALGAATVFFFKKANHLFLKIYDVNGLMASFSITNIFDFVLNLNNKDFLKYKKEINLMYNKLNRKNLLVQNVD